MEEKLRFVFEHELQERTMTELCDRYDASPSPSPGPLVERDQKVSDMRPV